MIDYWRLSIEDCEEGTSKDAKDEESDAQWA